MPFDFWSIDDNQFFLQRLINNQSIKYMTEPSNKEMIEIISREWIMSHSPIMKYTIIQAWKKEHSRWVLPVVMRRDFMIIKQQLVKISFFFFRFQKSGVGIWLSYSNFLQQSETSKTMFLVHEQISDSTFGITMASTRMDWEQVHRFKPQQVFCRGDKSRTNSHKMTNQRTYAWRRLKMKANARSPTRQQQLAKGKPTQSN